MPVFDRSQSRPCLGSRGSRGTVLGRCHTCTSATERRLCETGAIGFHTLPKRPSSFWPGCNVTIAFFQSALLPVGPPRRIVRRLLPGICTALTAATLLPWH